MSLPPIANEGIRRAEERIQRAAERLARGPLQPGSGLQEDVVDLSAEMLALIEAKNAHAANAQVLAASDEMQKNILDILG